MQPYQERVVNEEIELKDKLTKLEAFNASELIKSLPIEAQVLLRMQAAYMLAYHTTLLQRINWFED